MKTSFLTNGDVTEIKLTPENALESNIISALNMYDADAVITKPTSSDGDKVNQSFINIKVTHKNR